MKRKALIFLISGICIFAISTTSVLCFLVQAREGVQTAFASGGQNFLQGYAKTAFLSPNANVFEQVSVGRYYEPKRMMHSTEGETVVVKNSDVTGYEAMGWFKEPVAFVYKGREFKSILRSEIDSYRQEGWNVMYYSYKLNPLGEQLQKYIKSRSGKFGIYVKNLQNGQELLINDGEYSAASIIKLFVMTGVYKEIAKGNLLKTPDIENKLMKMITVSDNQASNELVKAIGHGNYKTGFALENEMTKSLGGVNTQHLSLFIGYGDYVSYGRNSVSPLDCGRVLEQIYHGTLLSPQWSAEMLELLKCQERKGKIPYLLPEGTVCANKTGESETVQSDVGIVYSPNADYIICVLTNNAQSGYVDVQEISRMVYDYFNSVS